ncbi:MAG: phytanoyl-CoA dioxygenase family protein [Bacteroidia bacterium]
MNEIELKAEFEKTGFVKISGFFSDNELNDLKSIISQAQGSVKKESGLNQKGLIFHSNLFQVSEDIRLFIAQRKISGLVESFADEKLWVRWDQTITKSPGGNPFPWHRDNAYNQLIAKHYQFWIALTPMNKENGGLWLIPESHNWPKLKHEKPLNHWQVDVSDKDQNAQVIEANPGDVVLFSSHMLHKTEVNRSEFDRTAYVIEFMQQNHFDPKVEPPYFFIEEAAPKILKKHPAHKWYKSSKSNLIKEEEPKVRWV